MTEEQAESRLERQCICECEKVPQSEIDAMFKKYFDIFGIADYTEKQESIF